MVGLLLFLCPKAYRTAATKMCRIYVRGKCADINYSNCIIKEFFFWHCRPKTLHFSSNFTDKLSDRYKFQLVLQVINVNFNFQVSLTRFHLSNSLAQYFIYQYILKSRQCYALVNDYSQSLTCHGTVKV